MQSKEKLVESLVDFYEKVQNGVRPSETMICRICKRHKIERNLFLAYVRKVNEELVSKNINEIDFKKGIRRVVAPEEVSREKFNKALRTARQKGPDLTAFEVEKIAMDNDLSPDQKEDLRYKVDLMRAEVYRPQAPREKKRLREERAKKIIRRRFIENPRKLNKETIREVSRKYQVPVEELINYYCKKKESWLKDRMNAKTIEELL